MKKLCRAIIVLLAALAAGACGFPEKPPQFAGADITGAPWGRDFRLTDHHGKPRSLADFRGKIVILFFGYTNCPDMCPATMFKLANAVKALGRDANRVQVLFMTLDPKRDTVEILSRYVPAFHPSFLGMYADEQVTARTAQDFKVFYQHQKPDAGGFYTVDHMGPSFVFDPQGRLRLYFSDDHAVEEVAQDLRTLLKG